MNNVEKSLSPEILDSTASTTIDKEAKQFSLCKASDLPENE